MFGGFSNGHPGFPAFALENQSQYDMVALPQLQLFGEFPVGCTVDRVNYVGNEDTAAANRPMKRACEPEPNATQQKLLISLNSNFCQDDAGHARTTLNSNPVSTGLRLSCEEDERNSSITSACENMKVLNPVTYSLTNSIKLEMDRQKELVDHYVKVQEENLVKGMRDLTQRHTASLLNALEKEVGKKLSEKEMEIDNLNRKNMELGLKIKQVSMEAQSWHYRAKYNESVVNSLKTNLQQVIASQGPGQGKEGYGDSEVEDAASCTNILNRTSSSSSSSMKPLNCKACNGREVCVVLFPCRHLCLCKECEAFTEICPVCRVMRTASVHVLMS